MNEVILQRADFIELVEKKTTYVMHENKILTIKLRVETKEDKFLDKKIKELKSGKEN